MLKGKTSYIIIKLWNYKIVKTYKIVKICETSIISLSIISI
jgi:hypothetical protein